MSREEETSMSELEQAKKAIMDNLLSLREPITREILLFCLVKHATLYQQGVLSRKNKDLLDQAVKQIWESEFDVEVGDIFSN